VCEHVVLDQLRVPIPPELLLEGVRTCEAPHANHIHETLEMPALGCEELANEVEGVLGEHHQ
jgi:hypothetical protein